LVLATGLDSKRLTERFMLSPNEGIRRSVKNGLIVGLLGGLFCGVLIGLFFGLFGGPGAGLRFGLIGGLFGGLAAGLGAGLDAAVQHYILRFWLWCMHLFPWQAMPFLDDAVEQLLLRRVGGGYIFRHRLLQDYFASLDTPPSEEAPTTSVSLQKPDEKE
jgi:hypothetical protein